MASFDPGTGALSQTVDGINSSYSRRLYAIDLVDNTAAPPTEVLDDAYILDFTAGTVHADWDGAAKGDIVRFNGTTWEPTTPVEGYTIYLDAQNKDAIYTDDGTPAWTLRNVAVASHNVMPGLQGIGPEYYHLEQSQYDEATRDATDVQNGLMPTGKLNSWDGGTTGLGTFLEQLGSPTYTHVQDFVDITQSSTIIDGFGLSDGGSGTLDIALGEAIIKNTDSDFGRNLYFDFAGTTGLALTDNSTNYIYLDYNAGTPIAAATTSLASIDLTTQVVIGRVYRNGTNVSILDVGQYFANYHAKDCKKDFEVYGFQRASGELIGEVGTRNITVSAGVDYCAHNRITTPLINTSVADTFDVWNSAASNSADTTGVTQVDNANYWNGAAVVALTPNRYGTRFFYRAHDGTVHMQYGTSDTVFASTALDEPVPSPPTFLGDFALYIGRIIIQESAATFDTITDPFATQESGAVATDHANLLNLQGGQAGEYYHLTATEHGYLNQDVKTTAAPSFAGMNLTPSATGSQSIINITPSEKLASGSWKGITGNLTALNPTGGAMYVSEFDLSSVVPDSHPFWLAYGHSIRSGGGGEQYRPFENNIVLPLSQTDAEHYAFYARCHGTAIVANVDSLYAGFTCNYSFITRSAGAPEVRGSTSIIPTLLTNFGPSWGHKSQGGGDTATLCDGSHGANIEGLIKSLDTYNNTDAAAANMYIDSTGEFHRSTCGEFWKTNLRPFEPETSGLYGVTIKSFEDKRTGRTAHSIIADQNTFDNLPGAVVKAIAKVDENGELASKQVDEDGNISYPFEEEIEIFDSINWNHIITAMLSEQIKLEDRITQLEGAMAA